MRQRNVGLQTGRKGEKARDAPHVCNGRQLRSSLPMVIHLNRVIIELMGFDEPGAGLENCKTQGESYAGFLDRHFMSQVR